VKFGKATDVIFITLILLTCVFSAYISYGMFHNWEAYRRFKMHNITLSEKEETVKNGIYFPTQEICCVWFGGRTLNSIFKTGVHETCHHLVEKDYEHFCGSGEN